MKEVDMLVEFLPGSKPGLLEMGGRSRPAGIDRNARTALTIHRVNHRDTETQRKSDWPQEAQKVQKQTVRQYVTCGLGSPRTLRSLCQRCFFNRPSNLGPFLFVSSCSQMRRTVQPRLRRARLTRRSRALLPVSLASQKAARFFGQACRPSCPTQPRRSRKLRAKGRNSVPRWYSA